MNVGVRFRPHLMSLSRRWQALAGAGIVSLTIVFLASAGVPSAQAIPGTGILYGTSGVSGTLLSINPATGTASTIGPIGFQVPALAVQPSTGTIFAGRGAGLPIIYRLNPANGAPTLVGNTGLGFAAVSALDFRADGVLFASVNIVGDGGTGGETLATINTATGAATLIGPFAVEGMEAIAFDGAGALWGATTDSSLAGPALYRINVTTGAATLVALITGLPQGGGISSLQFACDGTLLGGTARTGGALNGGLLVRINATTAVATVISPASITGGTSLAALAFASQCTLPTPTPTNTATPTGTTTPTVTATATNVPPRVQATRPNVGAFLEGASGTERNLQRAGVTSDPRTPAQQTPSTGAAATGSAAAGVLRPPSTGDAGLAETD